MNLLLKFLLIFWMLCNTGIFYGIYQGIKEDRIKLPLDLARLRKLEIESLAKYKVAVATAREEEKGLFYSPYDYFKDLMEIKGKERQYEVKAPIRPWIDSLYALMLNNVHNGHYSFDDISKAREIYGEAVDRAVGLSPQKKWERKDWENLFFWFLFLYLKNLLPVFCFFVTWALEDRQKKSEALFPRPLVFLWKLVAHPIFLTKMFFSWIQRESRGWITEAEYRRTRDNFFIYLSEKETEKIRKFAETKLAISIWREMLLAEGLKPVHSLTVALLVTFVFALLPKGAAAESAKKHIESGEIFIQRVLKLHSPRMEIKDANHVNYSCKTTQEFLSEYFIFEVYSCCCFHECPPTVFYLQEVLQKILHIPIFGCLA